MQNPTINRIGDNFNWWFGVVEDLEDPLKLGRVRVRVYSHHTEDRNKVPIKDLPWAQVVLPPTSASINDIGHDGTGLLKGSWVIGFWIDSVDQQPMILGSLNGIPQQIAKDIKGIGFNDPEGKYPGRAHEPDTNRLARNDKDFPPPNPDARNKDQTKFVPLANGVLLANSQPMWDEPNAKYNATYPKNHVFQSESGHIMEIDDTKDSERIHEYHKSGTHYEIDAKGNKQTRVVANNYTIVYGEDYVNIKGSCHLTIDTNCTTYIKGNWDIQVDGNVNEHIKGTLTQTVEKQVTEHYNSNQTTNITGTQKQYATSLIDADAPRIDLNKNR